MYINVRLYVYVSRVNLSSAFLPSMIAASSASAYPTRKVVAPIVVCN